MTWVNLPYKPASSLPKVSTYAALPVASSVDGQIYAVETSTGIFPFRKVKGLYLSDGAEWTYLAELVIAGEGLNSVAADDTNTLTVTGVSSAANLDIQFNCAVGDTINTLVILSLTEDNTVTSVLGNVYDNLVMGAIQSKPTTTTCVVRTLGIKDGFSGLTKGTAAFVGADGLPTTTPPATGHLQCIGIAVSSTAVILNPSPNKVIR